LSTEYYSTKTDQKRLKELDRLELVMLNGIDAGYYVVDKARNKLDKIRKEREIIRNKKYAD